MISMIKTAVAAIAIALSASAASAITYNEFVQGDLSNVGSAPTALGSLSTGTNDIFQRAITPGDPSDYFSFTVDAGTSLTSITVGQFLANATGSSAAISFALGGSFGSAVASLPISGGFPTGTDLLALLAGGPLAAGTYTFLVSQPGAAVESHLQFNVTAVPVPASGILLLSMLGLGIAAHRRSRRHA